MKFRVAHGTALLKSLRACVRDVTISIAGEFYDELKRLNHAGQYRLGGCSNARRQRIRQFKTALAEQYHQHNRCC